MGKVMIIDLSICNGCHNCQIACKDEHVANDWSPIARPQPDTGQFWNKVINLERGTVLAQGPRGGRLHRPYREARSPGQEAGAPGGGND